MDDAWDDRNGINSKVQQMSVADKPLGGLGRGRLFNGRGSVLNNNTPELRPPACSNSLSSDRENGHARDNSQQFNFQNSNDSGWDGGNQSNSGNIDRNQWNPDSPDHDSPNKHTFGNRGGFSRRGGGRDGWNSRGDNFSKSNNGERFERRGSNRNGESRGHGEFRGRRNNDNESSNWGKSDGRRNDSENGSWGKSEGRRNDSESGSWGKSGDRNSGSDGFSWGNNDGESRSEGGSQSVNWGTGECNDREMKSSYRGRERGENGFRGGRGGRGGFNRGNRDEDSGRGAGGSDSKSWRGRGEGSSQRGDRRGGFNGHDSSDGNRNSNEMGEEKPIERYIPPELNESELFNGIPKGVNFNKHRDVKVNVTGNGVPIPIKTFEDAHFGEVLNENIKRANYEIPTPVQQHAIPAIMAGRDLMACAQTGSGKTAAFLLPILQNLISSNLEGARFKEVQEPYAVIIAPTRELAIQIHKEARKFSSTSVIKIGLVYGGVNFRHESDVLNQGIHLLVATVGKLKHHLEKNKLSFAKVRYLVLDEGDRMLDEGFLEDIRYFFGHQTMPPKEDRRTLLFSATFPEGVQKLANDFLDDYLFLAVGVVGSANDDVTQSFIQVSQKDKQNALMELLKENPNESTIIFVDTKRRADYLGTVLCEASGFRATTIHGDRLQRQREEALRDFKNGKFPLLIATSVCSRGLDINGVDHVINCYLPDEIDEYVHRIGRTGRVGNVGKSTSFFDPDSDMNLARPLLKILADANQEVPDWLVQYADDSGGASGMRQRGSQFGGKDIRSFKPEDNWENKSQVPQSNAEDDVW